MYQTLDFIDDVTKHSVCFPFTTLLKVTYFAMLYIFVSF